jgi:hypothetical protein
MTVQPAPLLAAVAITRSTVQPLREAAVEASRLEETAASMKRTPAAQRSALPAKEIKQLIQDSGHKVETGARLVDDAGRTIQEVRKQIETATAGITTASASCIDHEVAALTPTAAPRQRNRTAAAAHGDRAAAPEDGQTADKFTIEAMLTQVRRLGCR